MTFARYILENSLLDCLSLKYSNLILANGAIFLVNRVFKNKIRNWSHQCSEITGVDQSTAKNCAKDLYDIMQRVESDFTALKRKFSTRNLYEVSKYKIEKVKSK